MLTNHNDAKRAEEKLKCKQQYEILGTLVKKYLLALRLSKRFITVA